MRSPNFHPSKVSASKPRRGETCGARRARTLPASRTLSGVSAPVPRSAQKASASPSLMPLLALRATQPGAGMPDEVVIIKEVAALLKLAEQTHAGEIPAFRIRGQWHVKRSELDQWIDAQPRGGEGGDRGK